MRPLCIGKRYPPGRSPRLTMPSAAVHTNALKSTDVRRHRTTIEPSAQTASDLLSKTLPGRMPSPMKDTCPSAGAAPGHSGETMSSTMVPIARFLRTLWRFRLNLLRFSARHPPTSDRASFGSPHGRRANTTPTGAGGRPVGAVGLQIRRQLYPK